MKNITNLTICHPQDGETLYFHGRECIDIDVSPGTEEIILSGPDIRNDLIARISLRNIDKSFPGVKKIIIREEIIDISISNYMFPNVREIESESSSFLNEQYLIKNSYDRTLLNTFCIKNEEEVSELNVNTIADYAFEGCEKADGFFADEHRKNACVPSVIYQHAFDSSAFLKLPFVDGFKKIGPVIFAVDDTAEEIVFKRRYNEKYVCPKEMSIKNVKRAVIEEVFCMRNAIPLPETVVIQSAKCNLRFLHSFLNDENTENFEVPSSSCIFTTVDGILYSKDKKTLIKCPTGKTGHVVIPDGTEFINDNAFLHSKISSVKFPENSISMGKDAFHGSTVSSINFGDSLTQIGGYEKNVFANCNNLIEVEIPSSVLRIGDGTFLNCENLKSVILNEGLRYIDAKTFCGCSNLHEIKIPGTVQHIGNRSFTDVYNLIISKPLSGLLYALTGPSYHTENKYVIKKITTNEGILYMPNRLKPLDMYKINLTSAKEYPPANLYIHAATTELKQDTAYWIYKHEDETDSVNFDKVKKYLRRCAKQMAMRYMESDDEKSFANFVSEGFLSKAALKELLKLAEQRNDTSVAAYLLDAIDEQTPCSSFRL